MIRSHDTEYVRVKLPSVERKPDELGRLIISAIDSNNSIAAEKQATIEAFRVRQEACSRKIAALIKLSAA